MDLQNPGPGLQTKGRRRDVNKLTVFAGGLAVILTITAACCGGGGESSPAETATPARTERVKQAPGKPTRAPTPTPTPAPAAGWTRHSGAGFEIDLPDNWETWEPTAEGTDALIQALEGSDPELAEALRQFTSEMGTSGVLSAFDTQSGELLTALEIYEQESPLPVTIGASIEAGEESVAGIGGTVLSTADDLRIGGARAGRIEYAVTCTCAGANVEIIEVDYLVLPEPTHSFLLTFAATAPDYPALEPVFEQIAESFRAQES